MTTAMRVLIALLTFSLSCVGAAAHAQTNLADGFKQLPSGARIALMPADVELFEISAGGVPEPRSDWTKAALANVQQLIKERRGKIGANVVDVTDESEEVVELNRLHGAVGVAIANHHYGLLKLPTKDGRLDWTLGEDAAVLKQRTGADYALFLFIRDSYASAERKAAIVIGALFGIGIPGGVQIGYASLVDLRTGQVLWFNRLLRGHGDLRERDKAAETLDTLLTGFPQ